MFPGITAIGNTFASACQALGLALLVVAVCLVAFTIYTSFGNEHRLALARAAATSVLIGFGALMFAPQLSATIQFIFPLHAP